MALQVEEISPHWLRGESNEVLFLPAAGGCQVEVPGTYTAPAIGKAARPAQLFPGREKCSPRRILPFDDRPSLTADNPYEAALATLGLVISDLEAGRAVIRLYPAWCPPAWTGRARQVASDRAAEDPLY
jgi:hypothetical protein